MEEIRFSAPVLKSPATGGWTYVVLPDSATVLGTRGRVAVTGTVDGEAVTTSFMALGDGTHKLPVTGALLRRIGKGPGDVVEVAVRRLTTDG